MRDVRCPVSSTGELQTRALKKGMSSSALNPLHQLIIEYDCTKDISLPLISRCLVLSPFTGHTSKKIVFILQSRRFFSQKEYEKIIEARAVSSRLNTLQGY